MLEQSHVAIAGVVFNGLTEDLQNWSSYGYDGPGRHRRRLGATLRRCAGSERRDEGSLASRPMDATTART